MPKKKKVHIHDAVFKRIYRNPKFCTEILKLFFTAKELAVLDLSTLTIEESASTSGSGKEHRADIVMSIQLQGKKGEQPLTIYIILEHKSFRDPDVLLQIMEYHIELCRRKKGVVIPIVLLCCEDKSFEIPSDYLSWVFKGKEVPPAVKALSRSIPDFFCNVIDIRRIPLNEIWNKAQSTAIILYGMRKFWQATEKDVVKILQKSRLIPPQDMAVVLPILTDYYEYTDKKFGNREFDRIEREHWPHLQEEERIMPTIEFTIDKIDKKINKAEKRAMRKGIEKGIEQGIEQGMRRGRLEGRLETAKRMLGANMPDADICKLTGLTEQDLAQLKQKMKD